MYSKISGQQFNQNQNNNNNNNNQNNQNNNNNNQNQDDNNQNSKKDCAIAVGPAEEEDMDTIIDIIRVKIFQNFEAKTEYSSNPNFHYFTFFVNDQNLMKTITRNRTIDYERKKVYISPSEYPIDEVYIDYVESIFPECLTGPFLDLSDIKRKSRPNILRDGDEGGIDINSNYSALPFLLFLCSLQCQVLLRNVQYIGFDNNLFSNPNHLMYFSDFFPNLRKISMSGSRLDQEDEVDRKPKKNKQTKDNKKFLEEQLEKLSRRDVAVIFERPFHHNEFEDKTKFKNYFGHSGFRQPAPFPRETMPLYDVFIPKIITYSPEKEEKSKSFKKMKQQEQVQINKDDFPTNDFIENFISTARESIQSTYPFYANESFFSITVDKCPPNSPMAFYYQYSNNRMNSQFSYSQPFGVDDVINAQLEVFGPVFDSAVSSVNQSQVEENAYAVVIHGIFNSYYDEDDSYAFDRTLMIVEEDSELGFSIFNDHIFIRKSRYL